MKVTKIALSLLFSLSLGAACLIGASYLESQGSGQVWYAITGFALGLAAGIAVLRRVSPKNLGFVSIGLGSLIFIAAAILLYLLTRA